MPIDSSQTLRTADAGEQPLSPVQQYVSYDERPLPAIRRSSLAVSSVMLLHNQLYSASSFVLCFQ